MTRAFDSTILLDLSASRQLFAIFITAVQAFKRSCCISAYSHFFYNNSVCCCFSKYHHWGEKLLYIHNFRGQPIGPLPLKRLLFLKSSAQNFLIPTANLLIIPGPLFCLDCLSPMMVSIISSWSWRFPSCETLSSTVVLFLLWCDDATRLWSKVQKSFAACL